MNKCPQCKTENAYIGFLSIECLNLNCSHFSERWKKSHAPKDENNWRIAGDNIIKLGGCRQNCQSISNLGYDLAVLYSSVTKPLPYPKPFYFVIAHEEIVKMLSQSKLSGFELISTGSVYNFGEIGLINGAFPVLSTQEIFQNEIILADSHKSKTIIPLNCAILNLEFI